MSIPLFYPPVTYVPSLKLRRPTTIEGLCQRVGIRCRASGAWTQREVEIQHAEVLAIYAEPGDWGRVKIEMPIVEKLTQAKIALAVLAYGLHDLVAKQSIATEPWRVVGSPRGRPRKEKVLSNRERQRKFRMRKRGRL